MSDWARKFGLNAGGRLLLAGAPPGSRAIIEAEAPQVELLAHLPDDGCLDHIFFWPGRVDQVAAALNAWLPQLQPAGSVWLLMPKKRYAPGRGIDFSWATLQATALTTDLVDNKIASFSQQDYGTRFVIRREHRGRYGKNCGGGVA